MTIKQFKGSSGIQEFWSFLADESPRGLAVVVAAYFDERLGTLLSRPKDTFYSRIELGFEKYILTMNERDDLHKIRKLRNGFAHNLRDRDFDGDNSKQIDAMKTWQVAVTGLPQYAEIFPDARQRLLYVAGCFYVRLNQEVRSNSRSIA